MGTPSPLYKGYQGSVPLRKAARVWGWPPTPIWCQDCKWVELYSHAPSAPAWHVTRRPLPSIMLTAEWSGPRNKQNKDHYVTSGSETSVIWQWNTVLPTHSTNVICMWKYTKIINYWMYKCWEYHWNSWVFLSFSAEIYTHAKKILAASPLNQNISLCSVCVILFWKC